MGSRLCMASRRRKYICGGIRLLISDETIDPRIYHLMAMHLMAMDFNQCHDTRGRALAGGF
jgi:hypothetical protein